jgi:hypothetical protein
VSGTARRRGGGGGAFGAAEKLLVELAKGADKLGDASIRQDLMRLHTLNELARFANLRAKEAKAHGKDLPGAANIAKLSMSRIVRLSGTPACASSGRSAPCTPTRASRRRSSTPRPATRSSAW